jgi:hypothetical protein
MYNLKPRMNGGLLTATVPWSKHSGAPQTPNGAQVWGQHMWLTIDREMDLKKCEMYCYSPDEDPFDGEENALWSMNYLFYNKKMKRVCYLYLRGLSISSNSPSRTFDDTRTKRPRSMAFNELFDHKRTRYSSDDDYDEEDFHRYGSAEPFNDTYVSIDMPGDDEVDRIDYSDYYSSEIEEEDDENDVVDSLRHRNVRAISEDVAPFQIEV